MFNPLHASHMGGVWERTIGVTHRILDSMLLQTKHANLTHDVLSTLMAEVSAIINARSLVPVSSDLSFLMLLTPAMLLTQKPGVSAPAGSFNKQHLFKCQWRKVQALANEFWRMEKRISLQPSAKVQMAHSMSRPAGRRCCVTQRQSVSLQSGAYVSGHCHQPKCWWKGQEYWNQDSFTRHS